jgi:hypothetical protein
VTRRSHVRPFLLRTASGKRVRVLADDRVQLVTSLGEPRYPDPDDPNFRTRPAALRPGTTVLVVGDYQPSQGGDGPYRGGDAPATMRPPRRSPLVVSTQPLRARFERKARAITRKTLGFVFLTLLVHLTWFGAFDLRELGRLLEAITGHRVASVDGLLRVWNSGHRLLWLVGVLVLARPASLIITRVRPWYEGPLVETDDPALSARAIASRTEDVPRHDTRATAPAPGRDRPADRREATDPGDDGGEVASAGALWGVLLNGLVVAAGLFVLVLLAPAAWHKYPEDGLGAFGPLALFALIPVGAAVGLTRAVKRVRRWWANRGR